MNRRVLIVEDDEQSCAALCRLLALKRIHSECAGNFADALVQSKSTRFDVVIVDLNLPDSEPLVTIDRMSELHSTRAIAFTGVDDPAIIRECQKRNIRFILKGTSSSGIMREILMIMEWNEPSPEIEEALIENAKVSRLPAPWYQRLAPVVVAVISLVSASFVGGAALFNTISERATEATQTREHFEKLDEAILLQKNETMELRRNQTDLMMKAQLMSHDQTTLAANQDLLRTEIIRRLERIEDKISRP